MDLFEKITLKEVAKILNRKFIGSEKPPYPWFK